jgi:hypothetical protein
MLKKKSFKGQNRITNEHPFLFQAFTTVMDFIFSKIDQLVIDMRYQIHLQAKKL